jgi:hypothetical protein
MNILNAIHIALLHYSHPASLPSPHNKGCEEIALHKSF